MDYSSIKPVEMMDGEFDDFIGIWENFLPKPFCVRIINTFEEWLISSSLHPSMNDENIKISYSNISDGINQFDEKNLGRKDKSIFINTIDKKLAAEINQYLNSCVNHYTSEYGQLKKVPMISLDIKAQKTESGGGYHVWHYENSHPDCAMRELVWAIYLNDIDDGEGETEFLYQKRRIKPTAGTVVIWPAGLTHVHRGNPVYTKPKYILTGWYLKRPV